MAARDTRNHIIDTASELFYNRGYNLVGINEIIAKSDIAKATLYSHFKTKEDLLLAYLDKMDRDFMCSIKATLDEEPSGDEKIRAVLKFLLPYFNQDNFNGCWCVRSLAEVPRDNAIVRKYLKESKSRFLRFLKLLVFENKPELNSEQRESLSLHLYLLYEGAMTGAHLHNEAWPIEHAIELLNMRLQRIS